MIFTRRGGLVIYYGVLMIAIAIAIAGYQSISIFTEPFLTPFFQTQGATGSGLNIDFSFLYPNKGQGGSYNTGDFFGVLMGWLGEFFGRLFLGSLVTISTDLMLYFLILGSLFVMSVSIGFPFFKAGASPSSVEITRKLQKNRAFAGDYLLIEVTVKNHSIQQIPVIEIYDAYPEVFELVLGENFITTQLNPKQSITFAYIVRIPIRGLFFIGPTKVILHDRQGFYSEEAVLADVSELLVYPSYEDIRKMEVIGKKRQLGALFGAHKTKIKGMGTDFWGIRKYVPEDSFKWIDWKAFSRTQELMVREFEAEQNIRVVIMVDTSASMGAGIPRNTKLEYGIRAAVLLAHVAMEKRDMVGMLQFDEKVRAWLEPTNNPKTMFRIMESLAYAIPQGRKRYSQAAEYVVKRLKRASLFVIISDLEGRPEDILDAVRKLRSHKHQAIVISPFGPWFEIRRHELSPTDRLIGEAIVEEQIARRRELFKKLQKYEVPAISVGPDDFLPTVLQQFNAAKQKGLGAI